MSGPVKTFAKTNAAGLSTMAFASYFDVYSHSHIFIRYDPWWNPAHLLLYSGFVIVLVGLVADRPKNVVGRLSLAGVLVSIGAAAFNEVWHRILLFGNPLPEPFPVEPPHALLAAGIIIIGLAAILDPLLSPGSFSGPWGRVTVAFTAGSLWLVIAGSAFYVGGAYGTTPALLFAVGAGSFASSLFIAYTPAVARKFGYGVLSYAWLLFVYFLFFISPVSWLPLGLILVALLDYALTRPTSAIRVRLLVLAAAALLYGVVYYPILPSDYAFAINAGLAASVVGVALEFGVERAFVARYLRNRGSEGGRPSEFYGSV
jgi:hypothetical protein